MDGPAGAGKSTVARRVAEALGLQFLDTGAMYRAVTLEVLARGVPPTDAAGCSAVAHSLELDFDEAGKLRIDGRPGEPDIRGREVTRHVSTVSAHPAVREAIVARQRVLGRSEPGVVAEGRDTTTVVFADADHKFFLNASPEERARRRALQEGTPERVDEILADIQRRDRTDTDREHSPLMQAEDAVRIDADDLTADQVVARILELVQGFEERSTA